MMPSATMGPKTKLVRRVRRYCRQIWKWPPIFGGPSTTTQFGSGLVVFDLNKGTVTYQEGGVDTVIATLHPTRIPTSVENFRGRILGDNFEIQVCSRWFRSEKILVKVTLSDGSVQESEPKQIIPWQSWDVHVLDLVRCTYNGVIETAAGRLSEDHPRTEECADIGFEPEFENLARILGVLFFWASNRNSAT